MSREKKIFVIGMCLLATLLIVLVKYYLMMHNVELCGERLRGIYVHIHTYSLDFDGCPPDIPTVIKAYSLRAKGYNELLGKCPSSDARMAELDELINDYANCADYIYRAVPLDDQLDAPLLYDKRLSNHSNMGIVILQADGTLLFDKKARWLVEYARQHPEEIIPLPQDLPDKTNIELLIENTREEYNKRKALLK